MVNAILSELGADSMFLNCATEGKIDNLRVKIKQFASTASLTSSKKIVVLDEISNALPAFQNGLQGFIEEFSATTSFILTGNSASKIIEPLHSRCATISYDFNKEEKKEVMQKIMRRVFFICESEGYEYDKKVIAQMVKMFYPDWRKLIHEIQRYGVGGTIDSGILANRPEVKILELIELLKGKKYKQLLNWSVENASADVYRMMQDHLIPVVTNSSMPTIVEITAVWQKEASTVTDPVVQLRGCLTQIMQEIEFK